MEKKQNRRIKKIGGILDQEGIRKQGREKGKVEKIEKKETQMKGKVYSLQ